MKNKKTSASSKTPKVLVIGDGGTLEKEIRKIEKSFFFLTEKEGKKLSGDKVKDVLEKHGPIAVLFLGMQKEFQNDKPSKTNDVIKNEVEGILHFSILCAKKGIRLVYCSSDCLYEGLGPHREKEPIRATSLFGKLKIAGEHIVASISDKHLILRLSFWENPYGKTTVSDRFYTSKLYEDEIAPIIVKAVFGRSVGVMNIGGPRGTLADFARRTKPDVKVMDGPHSGQIDDSFDITKMRVELKIENPLTLLKHGHFAKKNS
ncbi:MAG: sugar nucleotide-binding protein [bacterium]|nr:sugar nucleotide-binding protein [bacterium]